MPQQFSENDEDDLLILRMVCFGIGMAIGHTILLPLHIWDKIRGR